MLQTVIVREVLVSLPSGAGVVRLQDGSVVVTEDVDEGSGSCLREHDRFHPVKASAGGDQCVIGGLLLPGAVRAEVVDDRGVRVSAAVADGAYVAVIAQPDDGSNPIVCCRDGAGKPVRRPRAADYPSVRVTDAQTPCPACSATDFDEYRPFEDWRGGEVRPDGTTVPTPVVCCRVCGHEEAGLIAVRARARPASLETPPPLAELLAQARTMRREHMWRAVAPALQTQDFPIYGVEGWPAQLSGCGTEDDGRLTEVMIHHYETEDADPATAGRPRFAVTTKVDDPRDSGPLGEARFALRGWVRVKSPLLRRPGGSDAAKTLQLSADGRDANATALDAVQSEHNLTIDGMATTALVLTAPASRWVAVAARGNLTIIVRGRDVDPDSLRLSPIADPVKTFGPRPPDA
jgi:hypothetical protein